MQRRASPLCTHTCLRDPFPGVKAALALQQQTPCVDRTSSRCAACSSGIDIRFEIFSSDPCSSLVRRRHEACVH